MSAKEEQAYLEGQRRLALSTIDGLTRYLDPDDPLRKASAESSELLEARAAVRRLCEELGIDIPDSLHLGDLIEKYLAPNVARAE